MNEKIGCVIVAAGSGTRMGGVINKVFLPLGKSSVIDYTISAISKVDAISKIVIVTRESDILECMEHIKNTNKDITIIKGGKTRQESVFCGLKMIADCDIAVIHDGARALILPETVKSVIEDAKKYQAAATGVFSKDTLKMTDSEGFIIKTLDREKVFRVQTPQVFFTNDIIKAHELAIRDGFSATDDCALYEKYIGRVKISEGRYDNIKLTTPDDMETAENILKKR